MRICMLTSFFLPTIGGVEAHVYHLAKSLQEQGHEVVVVHTCFDIENNSAETFRCESLDGIEVHRLYIGKSRWRLSEGYVLSSRAVSYANGFLRKIRPIFQSKRISEYILGLHKKSEFDIVHQHDFISNMFTTKKLSRYLPVVLTNHTGEFLLLNRSPITRLMLRYLLDHLSFLVGPSEELCDVDFLKKRKRVAYIANGVDVNEFIPKTRDEIASMRKEMGYESDVSLVLCARRWAPTKGVIYFAKALKAILAKRSNVRFLISGNDYYGYPEYRKEVFSFIEDQDVRAFVTLLGDIPHAEIQRYYQIADIVVLPSLMEATSLSGLEAMSCGKALLGTNVGGIPEIIEDGRNGRLIRPENSEEIADAIVDMLRDRERLNEMGQYGRGLAVERFSWNQVANKTLVIYEKVCKQNLFGSRV